MKIQHAFNRIKGMTLFEVLVILGLVVLLTALLLPALAAAKRKHSRIGCVNCIKEIGLAFRVWSGDNDDKLPMQFAVTNADTMKAMANVRPQISVKLPFQC